MSSAYCHALVRHDRKPEYPPLDYAGEELVIALNPHAGSMIVQTDSGQPRALDGEYVASHLEHAHALTAHSAQGATVNWAGVIGRPGDFTREWAYTSLSRAREQTTLHLIRERSEHERERDEYAPAAPTPSHSRP